MNINLNSIPDNEVAVSKTVKPSVGLFTITGGESKVNVNNNAYIRFSFTNKEGQKFNQDFYINNDKGLGRVRELAINANVELGETDIDTLITRFIGKEVGLIVDGEKEFAEIDGIKRIVTRPRLRFAKFAFKTSELAEKVNTPVKIDDSKVTINVADDAATAPTTGVNDLPF